MEFQIREGKTDDASAIYELNTNWDTNMTQKKQEKD